MAADEAQGADEDDNATGNTRPSADPGDVLPEGTSEQKSVGEQLAGKGVGAAAEYKEPWWKFWA